jgi:hypothetical protein
LQRQFDELHLHLLQLHLQLLQCKLMSGKFATMA